MKNSEFWLIMLLILFGGMLVLGNVENFKIRQENKHLSELCMVYEKQIDTKDKLIGQLISKIRSVSR